MITLNKNNNPIKKFNPLFLIYIIVTKIINQFYKYYINNIMNNFLDIIRNSSHSLLYSYF